MKLKILLTHSLFLLNTKMNSYPLHLWFLHLLLFGAFWKFNCGNHWNPINIHICLLFYELDIIRILLMWPSNWSWEFIFLFQLGTESSTSRPPWCKFSIQMPNLLCWTKLGMTQGIYPKSMSPNGFVVVPKCMSLSLSTKVQIVCHIKFTLLGKWKALSPKSWMQNSWFVVTEKEMWKHSASTCLMLSVSGMNLHRRSGFAFQPTLWEDKMLSRAS